MRKSISIEMSDDGLSIAICADRSVRGLIQPVMEEIYKTLVEFIDVATTAKRYAPGLERELIEMLQEVKEHASDIVDAELDKIELD